MLYLETSIKVLLFWDQIHICANQLAFCISVIWVMWVLSPPSHLELIAAGEEGGEGGELKGIPWRTNLRVWLPILISSSTSLYNHQHINMIHIAPLFALSWTRIDWTCACLALITFVWFLYSICIMYRYYNIFVFLDISWRMENDCLALYHICVISLYFKCI